VANLPESTVILLVCWIIMLHAALFVRIETVEVPIDVERLDVVHDIFKFLSRGMLGGVRVRLLFGDCGLCCVLGFPAWNRMLA
jgi:hypothetical protein